MTEVVAIVPAKDRVDSVAATVEALHGLAAVDRVVVVDDGSADGTGEAARMAGADVLRLAVNRGKGGAVLAGADAAPDADVFLLIDADLAATAGVADQLLAPVLADEADLVIGVLPSAGGKGGFGLVRELARRGIQRATGRRVRAPLSGQRAVQAPLLRDLRGAERFGLEVAMTIDALRAGARVVEVDVAMDHRHTGRSLGGFSHRARQGIDVVRALWPRLTSRRQRTGLALFLLAVVLGTAVWTGTGWVPSSEPLAAAPSRVVVFGMAPMGFDDLGEGNTPTLDRLIEGDASVAAMSTRTGARLPTITGGYVSLGAGSRLQGTETAGEAYSADTRLGSGTAAEVLARRTGTQGRGRIAVVGAPTLLEPNDDFDSEPGALGEALERAGLRASVVSNADQPVPGGPTLVSRPAALAVMDRSLAVDAGTVDAEDLLVDDPTAPYGVRADPDKFELALASAAGEVVIVDPGDLQRAEAFALEASGPAQRAARQAALRRTDAILARVLETVDDDTLVLVVSVVAPDRGLRLTPVVATGAGVVPGYIVSPSTKREGLTTVTDLAPTILAALGAEVPDAMLGRPLRFRAADVDVGRLRDYDQETVYRERTYSPLVRWFVVTHALLYPLLALLLWRNVGRDRFVRTTAGLRVALLALAAVPLATFLFRLVPRSTSLGGLAVALQIGMALGVALLANRARRHPLSPLGWILASTTVVLVADACSGTFLHLSSWLGYSLHAAGRFYGIPNTTFAVLAATTLLLVCTHVQYAARRSEAVLAGGLLFVVVLVADGAPDLGGDVGGMITLVPLFGLTLLALTGRRLRLRALVPAVVATVAVVAVAAGLDLLRPEASRTHLGDFADRLIGDGPGELWDTIQRKEVANLNLLVTSIWTWLVVLAAAFLAFVLGLRRRWDELLPPGSALRVGVVATAAGAVLGFFANDSGPIVVALFAVYLLPFVALLALDERRRTPEWWPARAVGEDVADLALAGSE